MKTTLIALATAFGLIFALADAGFTQDRPSASHGGQIKSGKVKRSLPLRTAPQTPPETRGGTLEENNDGVIYF